jgi:hypothetical protein
VLKKVLKVLKNSQASDCANLVTTHRFDLQYEYTSIKHWPMTSDVEWLRSEVQLKGVSGVAKMLGMPGQTILSILAGISVRPGSYAKLKARREALA